MIKAGAVKVSQYIEYNAVNLFSVKFSREITLRGEVVVKMSDFGSKGPGFDPGGAKKLIHVCKYLPLLSCVLSYIMCLIVVSVCTIVNFRH